MAPSLRKLAVEDPVEGVLLKRRIVKGLEGSAWQNRVSLISLISSNASFLNSASPAVKLVAVSMVKRDRRVGAQPQGGVAIDTCENPLSQQVKGAMQSGVKLVTRLRRC